MTSLATTAARSSSPFAEEARVKAEFETTSSSSSSSGSVSTKKVEKLEIDSKETDKKGDTSKSCIRKIYEWVKDKFCAIGSFIARWTKAIFTCNFKAVKADSKSGEDKKDLKAQFKTAAQALTQVIDKIINQNDELVEKVETLEAQAAASKTQREQLERALTEAQSKTVCKKQHVEIDIDEHETNGVNHEDEDDHSPEFQSVNMNQTTTRVKLKTGTGDE